MLRSLLSRLLVCGLLVTTLSVAPLAAAEPAGPPTPRAAWLSGLWSWLESVWGESGCYIDPNGGCGDRAGGVPAAPEGLDSGCYIDPSGGCHDHAADLPSVPDGLDGGCYIDPHGGCLGGR